MPAKCSAYESLKPLTHVVSKNGVIEHTRATSETFAQRYLVLATASLYSCCREYVTISIRGQTIQNDDLTS